LASSEVVTDRQMHTYVHDDSQKPYFSYEMWKVDCNI